MKKILACLAVLIPVVMFGQSAAMLSMAQAELQKRGLNETEVRTRLMEEGIDVDNIPPTEYANYQSRVLAILNKMQAEKNAADVTPAAAATGGVNVVSTAEDAPQTTTGEAAAEAAGCRTLGGLGMLLYQGAAAFSFWTGKDMPVDMIRERYFPGVL